MYGFVCLCYGFTAQSTQWVHVEHSQFTSPHFYWAGLVLKAFNQYCAHFFTRKWQLPFLNQRKGEKMVSRWGVKGKSNVSEEYIWDARSWKTVHFDPNLIKIGWNISNSSRFEKSKLPFWIFNQTLWHYKAWKAPYSSKTDIFYSKKV